MNSAKHTTRYATPTDWPALLAPVALQLLGEPNRLLSRRSDLRYGKHGSLSLERQKGVWYDHEEGRGGGVLDLVTRELRCDQARALEWLRDHGHLPAGQRISCSWGSQRPPRVQRTAAPSPPRSRSVDSTVRSARVVEPLWSSSIPADGTPGNAYLHERGAWPAWAYAINAPLPEDVRWVSREGAPPVAVSAHWPGLPDGACGALLVVLRSAATGEVQAVLLEGLDVTGARLPERWRRAFGSSQRTVFVARDAEGSDTVHLVEGPVDALAHSGRRGSSRVAGGSSRWAARPVFAACVRRMCRAWSGPPRRWCSIRTAVPAGSLPWCRPRPTSRPRAGVVGSAARLPAWTQPRSLRGG